MTRKDIFNELKKIHPNLTSIEVEDDGTAVIHFSDGHDMCTNEFSGKTRKLMVEYEELSMDFDITGEPLI